MLKFDNKVMDNLGFDGDVDLFRATEEVYDHVDMLGHMITIFTTKDDEDGQAQYTSVSQVFIPVVKEHMI
jgi:hypothetical protein